MDEVIPTGQHSHESRIIVLASIGHTLCHIGELAYFGLIPAVITDLRIELDEATLLAVPGLVMYGVGALPTGMWADRHGSAGAMKIYFSAVAVACLVIYFAHGAVGLCLGLTCLGAAISIYHPAGLAMLSLGCANRGRAMGINGVAGSLGVATGPALGLLVLTQYSWRITYLIIAGLAFLGLICSILLHIKLPATEPAAKKARPSGNGSPLVLALLFMAMLVGGFNYRCLTTVLPAYLSDSADVVVGPSPWVGGGQEQKSLETKSLSAAGSGIVFLVFAMGGIGQLAGGILSDRYRPVVPYIIAIATTIPLAFAIARSSLGAGTWLAGTLVVFMFAEQPCENYLIAEATPAKHRGTVYGLKFVLAFGVASLGTWVAGLTGRFAGIERVFDIYGLGAMLMAGLAVTYAFASGRNVAVAPVTN